MKYKVGDKVKVKENLPLYIKDHCVSTFSPETLKYNGMIVTVSEAKKDQYKIEEDKGFYDWYEDMFEPVEEMSAEELAKIISNICEAHNECSECPILEVKGEDYCMIGIGKNADKALKIAKQWKADHEKKDVEVEFACIVRVIEDTGSRRRCVYEEDVTGVKDETFKMTMKRILEEYCKEHEGKFFTVYEEICRVKE